MFDPNRPRFPFPSPASLQGSMSEQDVLLSQLERAQQAQQALLAQNAQETAQASQQANQAYQGAAQAPVPGLDPMAQLLGTLVPGIASVITKDQGFQERGRQNLQQQQKDLLEARSNNLLALRDVAKQKAELAEKAGDLEAQGKARGEIEKYSRQLEQLNQRQTNAIALEGLKHQNRMTEQGAQNQAAMDRLNARIDSQGTDAKYTPDDVQAAVDDLAEGRTEINSVPAGYGFRAKVQSELRKQGKRIMPPKVRTALNEVGAAEAVIDEIDAISQQVNTAKANFASRGITGLKNLGDAMNQTGLAAQLESARGGLAGNLSRAIAAERGVLTDQDRRYAMTLIPTIWDSEDRAREKIALLRRFIQSKKERAIKVYTTVGAGTNGNGGSNGKPESAAQPAAGKIVFKRVNGKLVRQ